MAYFSNGSEGDYYEAKFCDRCVHQNSETGCPVWNLHMLWNYEAVGEKPLFPATAAKAHALNTLWPTDGVHNAQCAMFHEREEAQNG